MTREMDRSVPLGEIVGSAFVTRFDFGKLLDAMGFSQYFIRRSYHAISAIFIAQLAKEGKIPPGRKMVPTDLALDYLRPYGVNEKTIAETAKREEIKRNERGCHQAEDGDGVLLRK